MNTMQKTVASATSPLNLLHVGCGVANPARVPAFFRNPQWHEIRLDIDPAVQPDILGDITNMENIADNSVDAIWSSHNLEHLHSFQVPMALAEFHRVLAPNGFVLISVPDMRAIARHVLEDELTIPAYHSAAGPVTPLDMIFGHQASILRGNEFMAHRTGFTASTLGKALADAGFEEVRVHEGKYWDLWAVATMPHTRPDIFQLLAGILQ